MARHNIYLNQNAEKQLMIMFEILKKNGNIPANATEIGEYRARCITFAIENYQIAFDLLLKYQDKIIKAGEELGIVNLGDSLLDDTLSKIIKLAKINHMSEFLSMSFYDFATDLDKRDILDEL